MQGHKGARTGFTAGAAGGAEQGRDPDAHPAHRTAAPAAYLAPLYRVRPCPLCEPPVMSWGGIMIASFVIRAAGCVRHHLPCRID